MYSKIFSADILLPLPGIEIGPNEVPKLESEADLQNNVLRLN